VIAITGASAGIGQAVAERAAAEGAAVVLSARRHDKLVDVAQSIIARGGRALAVTGDVTREADMQQLVARAVETYGRLDVMLCNAGVGYHDTFGDTPSSVMRTLVDINLMGTFYAAQAAIRQFKAQNSGHIIAVSSMAGRRGVAGSSVYCATKAAQIGFIEALRAELYGSPIRASVVYPISTPTEFREAIERDYGHKVGGLGPSQPVAEVARAIVDCIRVPRPEVYPYRKAWFLSILSVIAPGQADRLVQRFRRRRVP
jgi:NADP-dependent 3-hydroxy acid dehydrogenase YdfG